MAAVEFQLLDACVLINLLASGEIEGILRVAAQRSLICVAVRGESIYLRTDDPHNPQEEIDITPLIEAGLIGVCEIENDEEELLYVDYASALDDGEAMTLAIALSRGYNVATDERKARRLFLEAVDEPERLASTPQIVREWAESESISTERLKAALMRIESHAQYQPRSTDPNYEWWVSALT